MMYWNGDAGNLGRWCLSSCELCIAQKRVKYDTRGTELNLSGALRGSFGLRAEDHCPQLA